MGTDKRYDQNDKIAGIINGDNKVIKLLYDENFNIIDQLIKSNGGNLEDAKDIFQESLVVLFRALKEKKFNFKSSISTFLYSVARIQWLKVLKRRKKQQLLFELDDNYPDLEKNIISIIEKNERYWLFQKKFDELGEDCKKVLRMSLNNVPVKEITRIMGYGSEQYTKNKRLRCKQMLIKKIKNSTNFKELGNETFQDD